MYRYDHKSYRFLLNLEKMVNKSVENVSLVGFEPTAPE